MTDRDLLARLDAELDISRADTEPPTAMFWQPLPPNAAWFSTVDLTTRMQVAELGLVTVSVKYGGI